MKKFTSLLLVVTIILSFSTVFASDTMEGYTPHYRHMEIYITNFNVPKVSAIAYVPDGEYHFVTGQGQHYHPSEKPDIYYINFRDLAMALRDTTATFSVNYDYSMNAFLVTTGKEYMPVGGENIPVSFDGLSLNYGYTFDREVSVSRTKLYVNGQEVTTTFHSVRGADYILLDDFMKIFDVSLTEVVDPFNKVKHFELDSIVTFLAPQRIEPTNPEEWMILPSLQQFYLNDTRFVVNTIAFSKQVIGYDQQSYWYNFRAVKLRDLAMAFKDTSTKFAIEYDSKSNAINVVKNSPYIPVGGEFERMGDNGNFDSFDSIPPTTISNAKFQVNGNLFDVTLYSFEGDNYIRIDDFRDSVGLVITEKLVDYLPVLEHTATVSSYSSNQHIILGNADGSHFPTDADKAKAIQMFKDTYGYAENVVFSEGVRTLQQQFKDHAPNPQAIVRELTGSLSIRYLKATMLLKEPSYGYFEGGGGVHYKTAVVEIYPNANLNVHGYTVTEESIKEYIYTIN